MSEELRVKSCGRALPAPDTAIPPPATESPPFTKGRLRRIWEEKAPPLP